MPYATPIELGGQAVILCACDVYADGLYHGTRWSAELSDIRTVPVNRWLCEQCRDNMVEIDEGKLRCIKRQTLTPEAYEAWKKWYEEHAR